MAQKVLTWFNSQLNNSRCNFHVHVYVPCLFFVLHLRIHLGVKDVTCVYDL